jgi:DNA-binding LacI/PurR family transcriptional regulator
VEEVREYSFEEGKQCLDKLPNRDKKFESVFCAAGDLCGLGVMERAKELGLKVKQDISIIGFEDIAAASRITPALTAVREPVYKQELRHLK